MITEWKDEYDCSSMEIAKRYNTMLHMMIPGTTAWFAEYPSQSFDKKVHIKMIAEDKGTFTIEKDKMVMSGLSLSITCPNSFNNCKITMLLHKNEEKIGEIEIFRGGTSMKEVPYLIFNLKNTYMGGWDDIEDMYKEILEISKYSEAVRKRLKRDTEEYYPSDENDIADDLWKNAGRTICYNENGYNVVAIAEHLGYKNYSVICMAIGRYRNGTLSKKHKLYDIAKGIAEGTLDMDGYD